MYIVDIEKSMYEYISRKMLFLAKNIKYVKAMEKISDVWNGIKRFLHQKAYFSGNSTYQAPICSKIFLPKT